MKKTLLFLFVICISLSINAGIINVGTYGAIPNDGLDDKTAINNAVAAAISGDTIVFTTGTYNLNGIYVNGVKIMLYAKSNLVIDGQGSTFACTGWSIVFGCYSSNNITTKNLLINWDNDLPFSGGTVIAKNTVSNYIDVRVKGNHSVRTGLTVGAIFKYDSINFRPATNGYDIYQTNATLTTSPSAGVLRCPVLAGSLGSITVGDNVVVRFQVYTGDFFNTIISSNITLQNITVNSAPGMALFSRSVTNLTLNNFNVLRKAGYWMSTTADGMHFQCDRGTINVSNCTMEGMGDDGINIHSGYMKITAIGANTINLIDPVSGGITNVNSDPKPGDSLEVYNTTTLAVVAKIYVQSVTRNTSDITVTATTVIPGTVAINQFAANASQLPVANISNSIMRNNRARGILIQNRNVTVNNCTLTGNSLPGILIETTANSFFESIMPRNVTVQNCTFNNNNNWNWGYPGQLTIRAINSSGAAAPAGVVQNIKIWDNNFIGSYNSTDNRVAISVSSADSIYIRGNTFDANYFNQPVYLSNTGYNVYINTANPSALSSPNGSAKTLPGTILAENIDNGGQMIAYFERTIPSPNAAPANSLLQKASCGGPCAGFYVNSIEKNEWLQYSVTVAQPSVYQVVFRCGSTSAGGANFHLEWDHVNLTGTLAVGQTTPTFANVTTPNFTLPAGTYPVRVVVESGTLTLDTMQFKLIGLVPLRLISMNVKKDGRDGHVSWQVSEENECREYHIYRSFNGNDYLKIGSVNCLGNNAIADYGFTDSNVVSSAGKNMVVYYRLENVERTGVRKILRVGILRLDNTDEGKMKLYPNPAARNEVLLSLMTNHSGPARIKILNLLGLEVFNSKVTIKSGNNLLPLDLHDLPKGIYMVRLVFPGEKPMAETKVLIKE